MTDVREVKKQELLEALDKLNERMGQYPASTHEVLDQLISDLMDYFSDHD